MFFVTAALIINILIIYFMPKKLSKQEIYITWGILAAIAINSDLFFGQILDLYDFTKQGLQLSDLFVDAALPPSYGIIYLNFMPKERSRLIKYILYWTIYSVVFEWLCVFFNFERLKGWSPWYSSFIYLLLFIFLHWHLGFIRQKK